MSILSAQTIRQLSLVYKPPLVEPYSDPAVFNGMSYGLSSAGYDIRIDNDYDISPGHFQLAASMEKFSIPGWIIATVHDKSTRARNGLAVQNTVLEPGWRGYITLELTNHSINRLELKKGEPIAQVIFHSLDEPTMKPYAGKYQDQEAGPQQARWDF